MRALTCKVYGPPENLQVSEIPVPVPGPGKVRIRVEAVGVGYVDGLLIQGKYQIKPPLPFIPGNEFAGVVADVGEGVSALRGGDRVFGISSGVFAEEIVVPAQACYRIPGALTSAQAAGFLLNYATALYGLDDCGHLQAGETVLVLGASGGVGSAAIAVARAMGLNVIAAASSPRKLEAAKSFGAHHGVCYADKDWRDALKQVLQNKALNAVFDPVGGNVADPALRSLSPGGRFLVVGFAGGPVPSIPLNLVLLKRCSIVGVDWGGASRADASLTPELAQRLFAMVESGQLTPPAVETRSLAEVRQALTDQLAGQIMGKLVIDMRGSWPES
jgi:NADPH2:quinone reductase